MAFILAYLCACQGLSLPDAYSIVVAARPCARPNAGKTLEDPSLPQSLQDRRVDMNRNGMHAPGMTCRFLNGQESRFGMTCIRLA